MGVIGGLMAAVGPLSVMIFTPALPQIASDLGTSEAAAKASITLFFAGFAGAQLICGTLSDGLGRRWVGLWFFSLYLLAAILALFAHSIEVLLTARFFQGIGAAAGISISRALVRDMFLGQQSSRIINSMSIIISTAPALAPTLGSLVLVFFGYRAIFAVMCLHGALLVCIVYYFIPETVERDLSKIRIVPLIQNFKTLLTSAEFMLPALAIAGVSGALYGQATVLPFILMRQLGLTPVAFGVGMFVNAGLHILGSLSARFWLRKVAAERLVLPGVCAVGLAAFTLAYFSFCGPLTFWTVMGPLGLAAFGAAHAYPCFTTAAMNKFPQIAGAAASLVGFMQMGAGFVVGMFAAAISDPVVALGTVIVATLGIACTSGALWYRRLMRQG
jgi:Bcr/CflA subfamily drug resistance transporter